MDDLQRDGVAPEEAAEGAALTFLSSRHRHQPAKTKAMDTKQPIPVLASADAFHVTAAGVQLGISRWVCLLGFTDVFPVDGLPQERVVAQINLSWQLTKALRQALDSVLAEYEAQEGDVVMPTSSKIPPAGSAEQ